MNQHRYSPDDPQRRIWQNPDAILVDIGLREGLTFADIGCGPGFFALPAARIVGSKGRVYGIDVDDKSIGRLRERARHEGLNNLCLEIGKAEERVLCDGCADIVFFGIVLHDFKSPSMVLSNAKRMLKPDGLLINLDWKKENMSIGPPCHIRFSKEKAIRLIRSVGFKIQNVKEAGPYHYIIVARDTSV